MNEKMEVDAALNIFMMIGLGVVVLAILIFIISLIVKRLNKKEITEHGGDTSSFAEELIDNYREEKAKNDDFS